MNRERFDMQRAQFERALLRLHEVLAENETSIVRDALIQRFEFTYEMAWLSLFHYLTFKGERVGKQAFQVLPLAFQALLIKDANLWDQVRLQRNQTSHTYDEVKAISVAAFVRASAVQAFDELRATLAAL